MHSKVEIAQNSVPSRITDSNSWITDSELFRFLGKEESLSVIPDPALLADCSVLCQVIEKVGEKKGG